MTAGGPQDRAARVATCVLRIVGDHVAAARCGEPGGLFSALTGYLRDEFADVQCETINEIRPQDE
jgi:hypothetical protein